MVNNLKYIHIKKLRPKQRDDSSESLETESEETSYTIYFQTTIFPSLQKALQMQLSYKSYYP